MHGEGADVDIADAVVREIQEARRPGDRLARLGRHRRGWSAAIVQSALDEFGRLDAVVSNAGIFHTAEFENLTPDDWERMVNVHLHGAFYLSQPAYRVMKSQGYGRFVFISSSAGLFGQPNSAHYAAAKSGVAGAVERHRNRRSGSTAFLPTACSLSDTHGWSRRPSETATSSKVSCPFLTLSSQSWSSRSWSSSPVVTARSRTTTSRPAPVASLACSSDRRHGWVMQDGEPSVCR